MKCEDHSQKSGHNRWSLLFYLQVAVDLLFMNFLGIDSCGRLFCHTKYFWYPSCIKEYLTFIQFLSENQGFSLDSLIPSNLMQLVQLEVEEVQEVQEVKEVKEVLMEQSVNKGNSWNNKINWIVSTFVLYIA